jgi:hypothetical protein
MSDDKNHDIGFLNEDTIECIETLFNKLEFSLEKELNSYEKQGKTIHKISVLSKEIKIKGIYFKIRIFYTGKDISSFKIINLEEYLKKVDKELANEYQ